MKDQGFLNSENSFVINSLSQLWRIFPESRPTLGLAKVLVADHAAFAHQLPENVAPLIVELARGGYSHVGF